MFFPSKENALDHITTAIEATKVATVQEYDLDAIFDATTRYDSDARGFVMTDDVNAFWEAVQAAELDT